MAYDYDVREIKLIKTTAQHNLESFVQDTEANGCVCLGHFDMMEIRQLLWDSKKGETPLDAICIAQKKAFEFQSVEEAPDMNYCYPLYIIQQHSTSPQSIPDIDLFWREECNYTVVTRLHCESATKEHGISFLERLISHTGQPRTRSGNTLLSIWSSNQNYYKLKVHVSSEVLPVFIAFYESLELGDVVAVIKSNSLIAILEVQRHLYECDIVSDSYSYYGIRKQLFYGVGGTIPEDELGQRSLLSKTELKYVSTRCSVLNANKANDFLTEIKEWPVYDSATNESPSSFFVSGTADLVIRWGMTQTRSSISEEDFLMIVKGIIGSKNRTSAFYDVITRIGLPYVPPVNSRDDNPDHTNFCSKVSMCSEFLRLSKDNQFASFNGGEDWPCQIVRMLATLNTMCCNSVTDELSAMLLSSVDAFLDRLCVLQHNPDTWKAWYDEDIYDFLNCWVSLTNDITHIEGQLVQHPELNSIRYFFPAMVLQLEQQWTMLCAEAIQIIDGNSGPSTLCPILVPSPVENTCTRCLLDPQDKAYKGKIPLRVKIPINQLYNPWKMLHVLCHEMAHYCGEEMRDRTLRLKVMEQAVAYFICDMFEQITSEGNNVECSTLEEKRSLFSCELVAEIKDAVAVQQPRIHYLKDTVDCLISEAQEMICNEVLHQRFVQEVYREKESSQQLRALRLLDEMGHIQLGQPLQVNVEQHIYFCLGETCKECYADVIMIYLLHCSFHDYYHCVYADEEKKLSSLPQENQEVPTYLHVIRMALVISALNTLYSSQESKEARSEKASPEWCKEEDCQTPWSTQAFKRSKLYREDNHMALDIRMDSMWCYLTRDEAKCILEYLNAVLFKLDDVLEKKGSKDSQNMPYERAMVERLRKVLGYTHGTNFDWSAIRRFVEESKSKDQNSDNSSAT